MPVVSLDHIKAKERLPGFVGGFIHTERVTIAHFKVRQGSVLPEHKHKEEQVTIPIQGMFKLTINGETTVIQPGCIALIPSYAPHSGEALTNFEAIDVFSPVREDYKID